MTLHAPDFIASLRANAAADIVVAFEQADHRAIRELGWWELWEACATWWRPRQTARASDMVPYAKLLKDERPAEIMGALRDLAGEWRPSPAQIKAFLNHKRRDRGRVDAGRGCDRAGTPEAIAAAAEAIRAGERGCGCPARPSTWSVDGSGVARCRTCRGLDWRQVFRAEDAGLVEAAA